MNGSTLATICKDALETRGFDRVLIDGRAVKLASINSHPDAKTKGWFYNGAKAEENDTIEILKLNRADTTSRRLYIVREGGHWRFSPVT